MKLKHNFKRILSGVISVAMAASMTAVIPVSAEDNTLRTYLGDGYEVSYSIKSSWDGNQNIEVTLTNTGSESLLNWALKYDAHGEIGGLWNGTVYDSDSTKYIVKNAGYNYEILPEQAVTFGYTLTGDDLEFPETVELCSQRTERTTDGYSVEMSVMNDWDTGFSGIITIQNLGDDPLEAWQLSFDTNFEITDFWNAQIIGSDGNHYTVANDITTTPIGVGESKVFGFSSSKESGVTPEISNFVMSEITVNSDFTTVNIPDDDIKPVINAFGEYNSEKNAIDIEWYSNISGSYEVFESNDNIDYTSIIKVSDFTTYRYHIIEDFDIKYFKVTVTNDNSFAESIPFVVTKKDDKYCVDDLDSDGDGLSDIYEEMICTDRNNPDTDGDGLTDYQEIYITKTDPTKYDSVTVGVSDADADLDNDNLSNIQEIEIGTNLNDDDTDGDGLSDGDEVNIYGTDPLKYDTDDDGIPDGDEIALGLDPLNSSSDGKTADKDRKFAQHIGEDSDVFASINTNSNPFKVSMDITSGGYAETLLSSDKSGYANVIQNDAVLGIVPEFYYEDGFDVDDVMLNFDIDEQYTENINGKYAAVSDEFEGIKRFNVFKYFDDIDMLLPIETFYDIEKSRVYSHVDELGTYCLIDMEKWCENLDIDPSDFETTTLSQNPLGTIGIPIITKLLSTTVSSETTKPAPIDVIFHVYLKGTSQLSKTREDIIDTANILFNQYGEDGTVRIYVASYTGTFTTNGSYNYATNQNDLEEIIANLSSCSSYADIPDLSIGVRSAINNYNGTSPRDNAEKYYVLLEKSIVETTKLSTVSDLLLDNKMKAIVLANVFDYQGLADYTDGYFYNKTINYSDPVTEFIIGKHAEFNNSEEEKNEYPIIMATGWKRITLDAPITSDYGEISEKIRLGSAEREEFEDDYADTDKDGLLDLEEIRYLVVDKIFGKDIRVTWDDDGNVVLPTLGQCMQMKSGLFYVGDGLKGLPLEYYDGFRILPIKSDPTDGDADNDYYKDSYEDVGNRLKFNPVEIIDKDLDDSDSINGNNPMKSASYTGESSHLGITEIGDGDLTKNQYSFIRKQTNDTFDTEFVIKPEKNSDYAITVTNVNSEDYVTVEVIYKHGKKSIPIERVMNEDGDFVTFSDEDKTATFYYALNTENSSEFYIKVKNNSYIDVNENLMIDDNKYFAVFISQNNWVYAPFGGHKHFSNTAYTSENNGAYSVEEYYMPSDVLFPLFKKLAIKKYGNLINEELTYNELIESPKFENVIKDEEFSGGRMIFNAINKGAEINTFIDPDDVLDGQTIIGYILLFTSSESSFLSTISNINTFLTILPNMINIYNNTLIEKMDQALINGKLNICISSRYKPSRSSYISDKDVNPWEKHYINRYDENVFYINNVPGNISELVRCELEIYDNYKVKEING